ncbi:MAG TPA: phenylacetic acid degradation operon negative regulatory protein PaaX [Casimicrobiaceae bacterium]|nr:phenylacetic acid degradation operon negative regulatory protein PaaX [Casimicrobiaceae bacterium]
MRPGRRRVFHATAQPDAAVARWIRRALAVSPPKAKSLVVTVWGDAIAPHGGALWLSGLIRLMAPLGLNERLVRTSVYRLTREGWLTARSRGRRSVYRLTAEGLRRFEQAYQRIYSPPDGAWNNRWDIVLAPLAGLRPAERTELRKELRWAGFGTIGPGLFIGPEQPGRRAAALATLRALGIERRATLVSALPGDSTRGCPLEDWVRASWDLAAVAAEYSAFVERFAPVIRAFKTLKRLDPEQCFVVRTLLIHDFRRVTLHDPQLAAALLPAQWPAPKAYALCRDFYRLTHRHAERHLAATVQSEGETLPPAAPYFYRRFGGLRRSKNKVP